MPPRKKTTKIKDKWREKKWIHIEAPSYFGNTPIAYIPITDEQNAIGRVVQTTLYDLTKQDPQHYAIKLSFQIEKIHDNKAITILKCQEYSREYLRSLVRRGSSMVNFIHDYITKDKFVVRIYTIYFTQGRANSSRKHALRMVAHKILSEKVSNQPYNQFAQEVVLGKLASDIFNEVKKVMHVRHVGIMKTKLLKQGEMIAEVLPPV